MRYIFVTDVSGIFIVASSCVTLYQHKNYFSSFQTKMR